MYDDEMMPEIEDALDDVIVLTGENGEEAEFEFLDLVEYDGRSFVVLFPLDEESEVPDGEVVILEVEESGEENTSYTGVRDEAVLSAVFEIFKEKFKDEFNFIEE